MTKARREVYKKSWFRRDCKLDMKRRKKEYTRKVRHLKLSEDACSRGVVKNLRKLEWNAW